MSKQKILELIKTELVNKDLTINTKIIDLYIRKYSKHETATQKLINKTFGELKEQILLKKDINKASLYETMLQQMKDIVLNKKMGQFMNALYIEIMIWLKTNDNWKRIDNPKETLKVINEISLLRKESFNAQFLSFTSLFLTFWNKNLYTPYDATVISTLKMIKKSLNGSSNDFEIRSFTDKIKAYSEFVRSLENFNSILNNKYTLNELNTFLYWYNRENDPWNNR